MSLAAAFTAIANDRTAPIGTRRVAAKMLTDAGIAAPKIDDATALPAAAPPLIDPELRAALEAAVKDPDTKAALEEVLARFGAGTTDALHGFQPAVTASSDRARFVASHGELPAEDKKHMDRIFASNHYPEKARSLTSEK